MKQWTLFIPLYLIALSISAQEINKPVRLKTGTLSASMNLRPQLHLIDSLKKFHYRNRYYTLIQFDKLPNETERKALLQDGIELYDYIADNSYLAEINDQIALTRLTKSNIRGYYTLHANAKIETGLVQQLQQPVHDADNLIAVSYYGSIDKATAIAELQKAGAQIIETAIQPAQVVFIDASMAVVQKIAALPFVSYINSLYMKATPLNYKNRGAHAVNALSMPLGRNLQGNNVMIGIGDEGNASTHIDFTGRIMDRSESYPDIHATHITGSVSGAGILNPKYKGMAPQATAINHFFWEIIANAPYYVSDYNMVLTNNSYGLGPVGCLAGTYNQLSKLVDEQMVSFPSLLHVFAAGNSASSSCSMYPASFATIIAGYQTGKNVLTIGDIDNGTYVIDNHSSRGPVKDGRLKPELAAGGVLITSTGPNNIYFVTGGTSCSAPTVTGILALLYERYRQLHGGNNPSSALIKAVACNGANDVGNPGPDYTYGFGNINARNSVEAIENNTWFTGSASQGGSATFTIPAVPAGTAQIKILLYWNDPAAAANAVKALVNDLDLTVTAGDGTVHYPLVLDSTAANVNQVAVEGIDSRNNIEQVVINNPPAGNCTVTVKGTGIARGPQDFVVVYQSVKTGIIVEYPFGEETLVPGEVEVLRWSASDANTNTFTIEYSLDNGQSWTTINNAVPATSRNYIWTVPASIASATALIRVSRNNTSYTDASDHTFTILDTTNITATNICAGYVNLSWSSIPAATGYDIMMLKGTSMQVVGSTTNTSYLLSGLNKDSACWLAVRGVMGATAGRRSLAATITPSGGPCASPDFDNDLSADVLVAPVTGRLYTSSQLGIQAPQVRITNRGNIATAGTVNISYQVNGGAPVTETTSISIAANANYTYTFVTPYNFSSTGTYAVKVWIDYAADVLHNNDTLSTIVKQLKNDPIILAPSFTEGFESAADKSYHNGAMGFEGLDRCDFYSASSHGRAQTFVSTGAAHTGKRSITLDRDAYTGDTSVNNLVMTFNLSKYTGAKELWLSLYYKNYSFNLSLPGNQVLIRGSDKDAWIPFFKMTPLQPRNVYKAMPPLNIIEALANASPAQTVSSSFQVIVGQEGSDQMTSPVSPGGGETFDDVTISLSKNDVSMVQLLAPSSASCAHGSGEPVTVVVKNNSLIALANVPVSYQVNSMPVVTENIPSIDSAATISYTFNQTADLSAFIPYTITAWTHLGTDTWLLNDTVTGSLPLPAGTFTITKVDNTALLQWETCNELTGDQFVIERSADGINFDSIATVPGTSASNTIKQYQFTDKQPLTGINYYRVKLTTGNGKFRYTPIRDVTFDNYLSVIVKPNPVTNGVLYISSSANCNRIDLYDAIGRLIKRAGVSGLQLQLPVGSLAKGIYVIAVITDAGKKVEKIVIE
ncbi:hypothetical protein A3860_22285 [Niastella vici]|uniref:Fibronectin type-III domain-containing protein n=1 Tax=Niastella vici TaxID=1703345 RepID=A0A1V9G0P4_9BACT|nr:S8 family serine peptidase [Niastella vici]OQP64137.1 hypothetical protein A3860_22285 [Niastella vici]